MIIARNKLVRNFDTNFRTFSTLCAKLREKYCYKGISFKIFVDFLKLILKKNCNFFRNLGQVYRILPIANKIEGLN